MRALLSTTAMGLMVLGFYLILDPTRQVDAAHPIIAAEVAAAEVVAPTSPGLRIELMGSERFEIGDHVRSRAWVAFEPDAAPDCDRKWPTTTVADATGLLGGV